MISPASWAPRPATSSSPRPARSATSWSTASADRCRTAFCPGSPASRRVSRPSATSSPGSSGCSPGATTIPARAAHLLASLEKAAAELPPGGSGEIALDWFNGRRTPDADQRVRAILGGLHLGSSAPAVYRALVEAVAFGTRAIVDRFESRGIEVRRIVALGGIPQKSPLVVQTCADVLNRPISVVASEECCARGAAVFAATAAGCHGSAEAAKQAMKSGILRDYTPNPDAVAAYARLWERRERFARFGETDTRS